MMRSVLCCILFAVSDVCVCLCVCVVCVCVWVCVCGCVCVCVCVFEIVQVIHVDFCITASLLSSALAIFIAFFVYLWYIDVFLLHIEVSVLYTELLVPYFEVTGLCGKFLHLVFVFVVVVVLWLFGVCPVVLCGLWVCGFVCLCVCVSVCLCVCVCVSVCLCVSVSMFELASFTSDLDLFEFFKYFKFRVGLASTAHAENCLSIQQLLVLYSFRNMIPIF